MSSGFSFHSLHPLLISCLEEALRLVDDGDRARLLAGLNDDELAVRSDGLLVDTG